MGRLDPLHVRAPDDLVKLKVQANGEPVLEDPCHQIRGGKLIPGRREEYGTPALEGEAANPIAGPFIIASVKENELQFVVLRELVEIGSEEPMGLPTGWGFHVDDSPYPRVQPFDADGTVGFDLDVEVTIEKEPK